MPKPEILPPVAGLFVEVSTTVNRNHVTFKVGITDDSVRAKIQFRDLSSRMTEDERNKVLALELLALSKALTELAARYNS